MMPRVLLVTHYFAEHRSGVELVAAALAQRLAQRGATIVWAASGPAQGPTRPGIIRLLMQTWNVTEERLGFPYPLWGLTSLLQLARAVRGCDVVHLHDCLYLGNVVAFLCASWLGKPVLVTQHIGLVPYSSRLLRGLLTMANHVLGKVVLGGCDRCVFVSPEVRDYFTRFVQFRRPPLYVANGVDTAVFRPVDDTERRCLRTNLGWPTERPVLLFVGRFVEKKGLRLLRRLAEHFPECEWVFVGWGPESPERWGLPQVRCLGPQSQQALVPCYQAADLLVLPSVGEGFPLVVQEALACGTPALISTDTARGCPGVEAVTAVTELDWDRLTGAVREALTHSTDVAWRAAAAAFARRHWDWEACADRYGAIYDALLATAGAGPGCSEKSSTGWSESQSPPASRRE